MALFPLLGILGLAGAAAAKPHYDNYTARARGNYVNDRAEEFGIDLLTATPQQTANFGVRAGLLGFPEYQSDTRLGYESNLDRDAAMARQRVASGPGYMNAQLARDRWNTGTDNPNSPNYVDPYDAWVRQQEYLRENPTFDQQTAMDRLDYERDQAALERQLEFNTALQGNVNLASRVDESLNVLDDARFDEPAYRTANEETANQFINQTLAILESDFFRTQMGRSDAPGETEMETLRQLFRRVEEEGFWSLESSARQQVRSALQLAKQAVMSQRLQLINRYTGEGPIAPQLIPPSLQGGGFE